ncbi:MAG: hypothetical protein K2X81_27015, partial [Candidatus Obscuribacterales bacterium]|nr:hypothetical protein [Candidatus Obscuribacterales bacterium]
MTKYKLSEILPLVAKAIIQVQENDLPDLNDFDFGERVLTCRLGFFLAQAIENLDPYKTDGVRVDCEYNRNIASPKQVGDHSQVKIKNLLVKIGELLSAKKVSMEKLLEKVTEAVDADAGNPAFEEFRQCAAAWGELAG